MKISRRFISFFLSLFAALTSFFGIAYRDSYLPADFPIYEVDEKAQDAVRIMSYNIRCEDVAGTPASRRRLVALEMILRVQPDSLGVQEATPQWMFWLRRLPGYEVVGEGRDGKGRGEHNPIVYNSDKYRLVDSDTFWLSETPDEVSFGWDAVCRRICTWAVLENRETGERYAHVNSHFDYAGRTAMRESAEMVKRFIEERFSDMPVVFTADMNAVPGSVPHRIMCAGLSDLRESAPDSKVCFTYRDTQDHADADCILDYVMASDDVTPLTFRTVTEGVNGRYVSDHFPIYADVQF